MAKQINSLSFHDANSEEVIRAFTTHQIYFEFSDIFKASDKQAIKNTIALVMNGLTTFGLCEEYSKTYGKQWRMWIGNPTQEERKANPLCQDSLTGLMDILFNPKKYAKGGEK